jgi:hypothetical protein
MSIGTTLLGLTGTKDPREALLAQVMAATQPSVPYATPAADPAAAATATSPSSVQRTPPQQPEAYKSPEDLGALYKDLLSYQSRAENIDRGIGLLGAAFAQPENKAAIMQMFGGQQPGAIDTDPAKLADLSMSLNKAQLQRSQYAAQLAAIPSIAKKYGIDEQTALSLMQSGKLDDFITKREEQQFSVNNRPAQIVQHDGLVDTFDPKTNSLTNIGGEKTPNVDIQKGPNDSIVAIDKDTVLKDPQKAVNTLVGPDKAKDYNIVDGPNGSKWLYNNKTNVMVKNLIAEDTSTPSQKDYKAYVADETMRGTPADKILSMDDWQTRHEAAKPDNRTPQQKNYATYVEQWRSNNSLGQKQEPMMTMDEWMTSHEKSSANQVNIDQRSQNKFSEKLGEIDAKRFADMQDGASLANNSMAQYDLAEKALNTGMYTGPGAELIATGRKIGGELGLDVDKDKVAAADVFTSLQNQLAMIKRNPESGLGLPGSISDRDINFLKGADINFGASVEGNKNLIKIGRALAQRKIDISNMANDYVEKNGNLGPGFNKMVAEYAKSHPMFENINIGTEDPDAALKAAKKKYGLD